MLKFVFLMIPTLLFISSCGSETPPASETAQPYRANIGQGPSEISQCKYPEKVMPHKVSAVINDPQGNILKNQPVTIIVTYVSEGKTHVKSKIVWTNDKGEVDVVFMLPCDATNIVDSAEFLEKDIPCIEGDVFC